MFIWNLFTGVVLLFLNNNHSFGKAGIVYLLIALVAFYGAHGINNENLSRVKLFTIFFLVSLIFYIVMSVVGMILLSMAESKLKKQCEQLYPEQAEYCNSNVSYTRLIIGFAIGVIFDIYLYIVLRSYCKELEDKSRSNAPPGRA
jgi:uncharacterized membrane protein YbjE (DUF340 family)